MTRATYELWLADPFGNRIKLLRHWSKITGFRKVNMVGQLRIAVARAEIPRAFLVGSEVVTIDIAAGTVNSNYRGSMLSAISPGSSFSAFALLPGTNQIAAYVDGATAQVSYRPRYWSLDHADVP